MSSPADAINPTTTGTAHSPKVDRVAQKTHETVDKVAESAIHAEQRLREGAAQAEAKLHEMGDAAQQSVEQVQTYMRQNPVKSAGIAFAAGLILSALLRR